MRLRAHDQGFVAASPPEVYAALADPATYEAWWPDARAERHRDGLGLYLMLRGGSIEWYLEPFQEGCIVNAFTELDLPDGSRRAMRRIHAARASIHAALVRLKHRIEGRA